MWAGNSLLPQKRQKNRANQKKFLENLQESKTMPTFASSKTESQFLKGEVIVNSRMTDIENCLVV